MKRYTVYNACTFFHSRHFALLLNKNQLFPLLSLDRHFYIGGQV